MVGQDYFQICIQQNFRFIYKKKTISSYDNSRDSGEFKQTRYNIKKKN